LFCLLLLSLPLPVTFHGVTTVMYVQGSWLDSQAVQYAQPGTAEYGWVQQGALPGYAQYPAAQQWVQPQPTVPAAPDPVDMLAQELGIEAGEAMHLGWIAEYGLQPGVLPERWSYHTDSATGRIFYADSQSGTSSWENPLSPSLRTIVEIGRLFLRAPADGFFEEQTQALLDRHKQELECWHGPLEDEEGRTYFANSSLGTTSWEDPRVETQFHWELEKTLLEALERSLPAVAVDSELPVFGARANPEHPTEFAQDPDSHLLSADQTMYPQEQSWALDEAQGRVQSPLLRMARHRTDVARNNRDVAAKADQQQAYKKMIEALNDIDYIRKDEAEAQRMIISRRLTERLDRIRAREKEQHEAQYGEAWRRSVEAMEEAKREEEALKKALADAEEARRAEQFRQRCEEERQAAEVRRLEEEERKAAEEARQRALAEKAAQLEAERIEKEQQLELERQMEVARQERESFLKRLQEASQSRGTEVVRAAIAEGEASVYAQDEDVKQLLAQLQNVLNEELLRRRAAARKARQAAEKLASEFKDAKEAQECGGATLAAQWRAAVKEVAKPPQDDEV